MSPTTRTRTRTGGAREVDLVWGDLEEDFLMRGDLDDDIIGASLPTEWTKRTEVAPTTRTKRVPI